MVLRGDGGGKAPALGHSVVGRADVARTLLAWATMGERIGGSIRPVTVNGGPGALVLDADGLLIGVWAIDVADGAVRAVASIVTPTSCSTSRRSGRCARRSRGCVHRWPKTCTSLTGVGHTHLAMAFQRTAAEGPLLIADISGYTSFLTDVEVAHRDDGSRMARSRRHMG